MNRYELVILIDTRISMETINSLINSIEKLFEGSISQKDDIGMLDLAYNIKGNSKAYFISYDLNLEPNKLTEIKKSLSLTKNLIRFVFFKLNIKEKFHLYKEVNKMFEISEEERIRQLNEKAFQEMDSGIKRKKKIS